MNLSRKKVILHDWDDTVTNSFETYSDWYYDFAQFYDLTNPDLAIVEKTWGATVEGIIEAVWPILNGNDVKKMVEDYRDSDDFPKDKYTPRFFQGVPETLNTFKQHSFKMGVLTSGSLYNVNHALERFMQSSLDSFYDYAHDRTTTTFHKPDPRAFNEILDEVLFAGYALEECLYIGDSTYDYLSAKGAGLDFIGVLTGPKYDELLNLDPIHVASFDELVKFLS